MSGRLAINSERVRTGPGLSCGMPPTRTGPAWALAIECSNPSSAEGPPGASVAGCLVDSEVDGRIEPVGEVVEVGFEPGSREHDGLMPAIESLRERLGVEPGGLVRIGVSIGPGGYTGLRVAVSAAMLLADSTGAGLVGVESAWVAAIEAGLDRPFVVCLASKRESAFAVWFPDSGHPEQAREIGVIDEAGLAGLVDGEGSVPGLGAIVSDRHLPSPMRLRANGLGLNMVRSRFSATVCLGLCLGLPPEASGLLVPRYAREPEAVRLWRSRHG